MSSDHHYNIESLKGTENYVSWATSMKALLIKVKTWDVVCGRVVKPLPAVPPESAMGTTPFGSLKTDEICDVTVEDYEANLSDWNDKNDMAWAALIT